MLPRPLATKGDQYPFVLAQNYKLPTLSAIKRDQTGDKSKESSLARRNCLDVLLNNKESYFPVIMISVLKSKFIMLNNLSPNYAFSEIIARDNCYIENLKINNC